MFRGQYLPPHVELGFLPYILGKPRRSSFQRFLRITIPGFLEGVMAVSLTVREAAQNFQVVVAAKFAL